MFTPTVTITLDSYEKLQAVKKEKEVTVTPELMKFLETVMKLDSLDKHERWTLMRQAADFKLAMRIP